jgi:hypothetical protein
VLSVIFISRIISLEVAVGIYNVVVNTFFFVSVLLIGKEENCTLHNYGCPEESECSIFDSILCGEFTLTLNDILIFYIIVQGWWRYVTVCVFT